MIQRVTASLTLTIHPKFTLLKIFRTTNNHKGDPSPKIHDAHYRFFKMYIQTLKIQPQIDFALIFFPSLFFLSKQQPWQRQDCINVDRTDNNGVMTQTKKSFFLKIKIFPQ